MVAAHVVTVQLVDLAGLVVEVTEDDGIGGAGLLAGHLDFSIVGPAHFGLGLQFLLLDPLDAEGALLHYTTGTNSHIWVQYQRPTRSRDI